MRTNRLITAVSLLTAALCFSRAGFTADSVYKCIVNGKTLYGAAPPSGEERQCQQTPIRDDGPSPEEWARIQEEKQRREEEQRKAELEEREVRAKELEAEAHARRARAEEQMLLLQPDPVPPAPSYGYPYYWGRGVPLYRHPNHPGHAPMPRPPWRPSAAQAVPSPGYPTPPITYPVPSPGYPTPPITYPVPSPGYPTPSPGYPVPSPGFHAR